MKCFGYTEISCEMGSDGYSSWSEFGIYEGDTKEDVVKDYYKKNQIFPVPDSNVIKEKLVDCDKMNEFGYKNYFVTYFIMLPSTDTYGHVKKIRMEFPVILHRDSKDYDKEKGGTQIKDYFDNYYNKEEKGGTDGKKEKQA